MLAPNLQTQFERFFPGCKITHDMVRDVVTVSDPATGYNYMITGEALRHSKDRESVLKYSRQAFDQIRYPNSSVGFYGTSPSPLHVATFDIRKPPLGRTHFMVTMDDPVNPIKPPEKENTMQRTSPTEICPACAAPEEQEITLVEQTFRVDVTIYGGYTRSFIVNAFDSVGALTFATEILSDEVEFDGSEEQITALNATVLDRTEILI